MQIVTRRGTTLGSIAILFMLGFGCGGVEPPQSAPDDQPSTHAPKVETSAKGLGCGAIYPGQSLGVGQVVWSCDGRYYLIMQGDGNLVLYYNNAPYGCSQALWQSHTSGTDAVIAIMQGDGNFVLYNASYQWR